MRGSEGSVVGSVKSVLSERACQTADDAQRARFETEFIEKLQFSVMMRLGT